MTKHPGAQHEPPELREKSHMSTRIALVCSAALLVASAGMSSIPRTSASAAPAPASAAPSPTKSTASKPATSKPATSSRASVPTKSGRQQIDGVDYYYELHGAGAPLLLLHGGLGSIDMLAPVLDKLAES